MTMAQPVYVPGSEKVPKLFFQNWQNFPKNCLDNDAPTTQVFPRSYNSFLMEKLLTWSNTRSCAKKCAMKLLPIASKYTKFILIISAAWLLNTTFINNLTTTAYAAHTILSITDLTSCVVGNTTTLNSARQKCILL